MVNKRLHWSVWAGVLLILAWAVLVGRQFLDFSPQVWPFGADYPLQVQACYAWEQFRECGFCVFGNGSLSGGLIFGAGMGQLFRLLVPDLAFLDGARYPAFIPALAVPLILGVILSCLGLFGAVYFLWRSGVEPGAEDLSPQERDLFSAAESSQVEAAPSQQADEPQNDESLSPPLQEPDIPAPSSETLAPENVQEQSTPVEPRLTYVQKLSETEDTRLATVQILLQLSPGMHARIEVVALPDEGGQAEPVSVVVREVLSTQSKVATGPTTDWAERWQALRQAIWAKLRAWPYSLDLTLFGLGIGVYLLTRLVGLERFPIYFFSDEAIQPVLASDFLQRGFRNYTGEFLPTFFQNIDKWTLGFTVYLHILPVLLLGKSVFVTRAVTVLVTALAATALGLSLRNIFKVRYWWTGPLLLAIAPAWFLHSRTAFETAIMASLYAGALYCYLLYRSGKLTALYPALILAACAFYAYAPGQLIVGLTILLLVIMDAPYHWKNRLVALRGLGLGLLLALPYVRFYIAHPTAAVTNLKTLNSYWLEPISLGEKLKHFVSSYSRLLSPVYWFLSDKQNLVRHLMKGYGHLLLVTLPFFFWGLVMSLRRFGAAAYRILWVALLVTPISAALVPEPGSITRCLSFVIPATLLIALGLSDILERLEKRFLTKTTWAVGVFTLLTVMSFAILRDALVNGPTWFSNYGLDGMQYGAPQVFGEIKSILRESPGESIFLSSDWTFSIDTVARFFFPDEVPVRFGGVGTFLSQYTPVDNLLVVLTASEYEKIVNSGKFAEIKVEKILPYPNRQPGFYFLQLRYADNLDELIRAEMEAKTRLQEGEIRLQDEVVQVRYSRLDMGSIESAFDGNPGTVMRTGGSNPMILELTFPEPRQLQGFYLIFGNTRADVKVSVYAVPEDPQPAVFSGILTGSVDQPGQIFLFERTVTASWISIQIRDTSQGEPGNVHVWELELR